MPTAQECVDAGFEALQEADPTGAWLRKVDTSRLHMMSFDRCVLGYVYGSYLYGLAILQPDLIGYGSWVTDDTILMPEEMMQWACDHGFALHNDVNPEELRDRWIAKITAALAG